MEESYYLCSENKGADQFRGYCEADLCLCFRICRLLVFPCGSSLKCYPVSTIFSYRECSSRALDSESRGLGIESSWGNVLVLEQDTVTPLSAGFKIPMKWWLSLHMTDKLLTRMLNLNANKQTNIFKYSDVDSFESEIFIH